MQNKANFRKSQMNVNKVLTTDYVKRTLGQHGKTKPIKANSKPIKANIMPKQSQYKANSKPICRGVASGEAGCRRQKRTLKMNHPGRTKD
jgi:hypothetical protein